MLPEVEYNLDEVDFEEQLSSKSPKLNKDHKINGVVDNEQAMEQLVYKILNTERYNYPIYTEDYGVEFVDLIGQDRDYVVAEVQRRIEDALTQDSRLLGVSDFQFEFNRNVIHVTFTVNTIYGIINSDKEVSY